jgi:hypothetical protein
MKAILEFNLPEEQGEFQTAQDGWKYLRVLEKTLESLRDSIDDAEDQGGQEPFIDTLRTTMRLIVDKVEEYNLPVI